MITGLDNQAWSKELVTGNAQFLEVASTIYVVSQVRADNTFAVFKSNPTPPLPGPGYSFSITAVHTFPTVNGKNNTSFDPVLAYDPSGHMIYIVGTQDNADGKDVDVILFSYSTLTDTLSSPTTLLSASYLRDSYDVCILGPNQFIAVAVTNPSQIWQTTTVSEITSISISGTTITVVAPNDYSTGNVISFSALQNADFLNGMTAQVISSTGSQFTGTLSQSYTYTQVGYESGFATWLPGHSLLGFEMDMANLTASPPQTPFVSVEVLDSSPFRSGFTFGAVSAISPDGVEIEVYYEAHPKPVTFVDQLIQIKLASFTVSPPAWTTTTLDTFTGRYADSRLTVIPSGSTRTLLQQYYSQLVHQNALVGNLLLGFYDGTAWRFHSTPGSSTSSYIQGTLSLSQNLASPPQLTAYVSYIAEPTYSIRGVWSPEVKTYYVADRVSYNQVDYITNNVISYAYKGVWVHLAAYSVGNVVKVTLPTNPVTYAYFTAKAAIPVSLTSPNLDVANWSATPTPDVDSRFNPAPTSWPLKTSSLDLSDFNLSDVPGFYNNLNFTWLRGSKSVLDAGSQWAVVGERVGSTSGASYISAFNVPPITRISPSGTITLLRGTVLAFSGSGTNDGDNDRDNDSVHFTWTYSPTSSYITLTPNGVNASLLVARAIGGASDAFTVGLVGVDYTGSTPLHPPMNVTGISILGNVLTVTMSSPVTLSSGELVFLYSLINALFLNDQIVTVTGVSGNSFTAAFTHSNYSASDIGNAIANAQFATCNIIVPVNYAPTIDFTTDAITHDSVSLPIQASRNSVVTINPTFTGTTDADDITTYRWLQLQGFTVPSTQVTSGLTGPSLQFSTSGALLEGDTLIWQLTVNDGVNASVTSTVEVDVAAYVFMNQDTQQLARSVGTGTISQRNSIRTWAPLDVSALYTNFQNVKRNSVITGADRYLLISSASVIVYGGVNPNMLLIRKLFVPNNYTILDAVHTEDDWTFVLDVTGKLYRYISAPRINTDNPDTTIDLTTVSSMTFNRVFTTPSFGNIRVVALSGPEGCILMQLRNTDLQIQGVMELSVQDGMLYGVDNVQFVRTSNVESLHRGKVLLGTVTQILTTITSVTIATNQVTLEADNTLVPENLVTFVNLTNATFLNGVTASVLSSTPTQFVISYSHADYTTTSEPTGALAITGGATYETLIDLSQGRIIGTWDASKLRNQFVTTGEILFEPNDNYAGSPAAPVMSSIVNKGFTQGQVNMVNLMFSWVADRPDLINSYDLETSLDGVTWSTTVINSGYIQTVTLPEPVGQLYQARIRAFSSDGISPYSTIVSIQT